VWNVKLWNTVQWLYTKTAEAIKKVDPLPFPSRP